MSDNNDQYKRLAPLEFMSTLLILFFLAGMFFYFLFM